MPEYPWDIENMMLEQHKQPCDCAICDDIHMARIMRRNRREAAERDFTRPTMAEFLGLNKDERIKDLTNALHIIAHMGISGLGYQADYEKCVNIAREALEI